MQIICVGSIWRIRQGAWPLTLGREGCCGIRLIVISCSRCPNQHYRLTCSRVLPCKSSTLHFYLHCCFAAFEAGPQGPYPYTNAEWLVWLEKNTDMFQRVLQNSTGERRKLSCRLIPPPEGLPSSDREGPSGSQHRAHVLAGPRTVFMKYEVLVLGADSLHCRCYVSRLGRVSIVVCTGLPLSLLGRIGDMRRQT
jgi:hypothetical protein